MKEKLRNIFLDLSNKKLTEQEALEKIKAVKLANQSHNHSLFAKPVGLLLMSQLFQKMQNKITLNIMYYSYNPLRHPSKNWSNCSLQVNVFKYKLVTKIFLIILMKLPELVLNM
jgi:RNA recognition motif-containing protein